MPSTIQVNRFNVWSFLQSSFFLTMACFHKRNSTSKSSPVSLPTTIVHILFPVLQQLYWDSWTIMGSLANMFTIRSWKNLQTWHIICYCHCLQVKHVQNFFYQTRALYSGWVQSNYNTLLVQLGFILPTFWERKINIFETFHLATSWWWKPFCSRKKTPLFRCILISFWLFLSKKMPNWPWFSCSDTGYLSKVAKQPNKCQRFVSGKINGRHPLFDIGPTVGNVNFDLLEVVGKSKKTYSPKGGAKWWFTMVESVKHHLKQIQTCKMLGSLGWGYDIQSSPHDNPPLPTQLSWIMGISQPWRTNQIL